MTLKKPDKYFQILTKKLGTWFYIEITILYTCFFCSSAPLLPKRKLESDFLKLRFELNRKYMCFVHLAVLFLRILFKKKL